MSNNKPVHEIRIGLVKAAIWESKSEKGSFLTGALSRLYKAEGGWKQSHSFGAWELPSVLQVVDQAKAWIAQHEVNS